MDRPFLVNWALPANVVPSIESSESSKSGDAGDAGDPRGERVVLESFGSIGIVRKEVALRLRGSWSELMYKGS